MKFSKFCLLKLGIQTATFLGRVEVEEIYNRMMWRDSTLRCTANFIVTIDRLPSVLYRTQNDSVNIRQASFRYTAVINIMVVLNLLQFFFETVVCNPDSFSKQPVTLNPCPLYLNALRLFIVWMCAMVPIEAWRVLYWEVYTSSNRFWYNWYSWQ